MPNRRTIPISTACVEDAEHTLVPHASDIKVAATLDTMRAVFNVESDIVEPMVFPEHLKPGHGESFRYYDNPRSIISMNGNNLERQIKHEYCPAVRLKLNSVIPRVGWDTINIDIGSLQAVGSLTYFAIAPWQLLALPCHSRKAQQARLQTYHKYPTSFIETTLEVSIDSLISELKLPTWVLSFLCLCWHCQAQELYVMPKSCVNTY